MSGSEHQVAESLSASRNKASSGRRRGLLGLMGCTVLASTVVVVSPVATQMVEAAGTISLLTKAVAPASTTGAPLGPGDLVNYTISYDCSGLGQGDNCTGAVITDTLPSFTDIYGLARQLEFVSASSSVPADWTFQGLTGASPSASVSWEGTASLVAGDTGAVSLTLRVPLGVVPALPVAQAVSNIAAVDLGPVHDEAGPAVSYINAPGAVSGISKSGPSSLLLNSGGTDPFDYTIRICPVGEAQLWTSYQVTDTLPVGATVVPPISFGGAITDPGTPSTPGVLPDDPPVPGTGPTVEWSLAPGNMPTPDSQGCLPLPLTVRYINANAVGGDLTNVIGEEKTNSVSAVGSDPVLGTQDIGPAATTLTLAGPVTRFNPSKTTGGNYYVQNGDTVTYSLGASNTSDAEAVPFSTAELLDGPLPVDYTLTEIHTGSWPGAVSASIDVSADGTNWTQVATAPNTTVTTGLAGVRWVRWAFTSTGVPAIGPGWATSGLQLVGTVAGTPPPSVTYQNCVTLTGTQDGVEQNRGSRCAVVEMEVPQSHPSISKNGPSTLSPGDTITYTLTAANAADATSALVNPQLTDCVPDSAHLVVGNIVLGAGWAVEAGPTPSSCTPTEPAVVNSGTYLQFQYTGTLAPGQSAPAVAYDVTADAYQFPTVTDTPALPGIYRNTVVITGESGGPFTHCVQQSCSATHQVTVPVTAELQSNKLVKGALDADFNIAGTTTPGGQVTWKLMVQNIGNVEVASTQYVDVFGFVGDTGVRVSTKRGSEFSPYLTSPITAPPGWTVEYSTSSNPCRPEVLGPNSSCDAPNWVSVVSPLDLPLYKAVRFTYAGRIAVGESLSFEWSMVSPVFDPTYDTPSTTASPYDLLFDCSVPISTPPYDLVNRTDGPGNSTITGRSEAAAWVDSNADGLQQVGEGGPTCPRSSNSFAYGVDVPADQLGGLPDPGRLGAEPPKVDLFVVAEPQVNTLGDRVWFDYDYDGVQDLGEAGVPWVRVELLDAANTLLAVTFTDGNGNYLFEQLADGDYKVRFYPPTGWVVSPADATGAAGDTNQTDPDDETDSDALGSAPGVYPPPLGTNGTGAYYDTALVTLGVADELDPTWDTGIWSTVPSINVVKVTKDTDWPDNQAGDGVNILQGRPVTWIYTVTNTGNTRLENVTLGDNNGTAGLGDDVTITTCTITDDGQNAAGLPSSATAPMALNRGATMECRLTGTALRTNYSNVATVTGTPVTDDGDDVVHADVNDTDPSSYFSIKYDLALAKTVDTTNLLPNGQATFTITVKNEGGVDSGAFEITDLLPNGMSLVGDASPLQSSATPTSIVWTNQPNLAPNATRTYTFTVQVDSWATRPWRNVAEISDDSSEGVTSGGVATPTTDSDSTPDADPANDNTTYGPIGSPVAGADNANITEAGSSAYPNTGDDPLDGQDDADVADLNPTVVYDLALAKVVTVGPVANPLAPEFTVRVYNQGNVPARAFTVVDQMPTGLTFDAANSSALCVDNLDTTITCSIANLAPGAFVDLVIATTVDSYSSGPWRNWAEIATDSSAYYATTDPDSTPEGTEENGTGLDDTLPGDDYTGVGTLDATYTAPGTPDEDDNDDARVGALVSIGDYVWLDVNRDGQQTLGEPFIADVTVELRTSGGAYLTETTTDAQGYYSFTDLLPETDYLVVFLPPTGHSFTAQFQGATVSDSNANPSTGQATVTTPGTGFNAAGHNLADDPTIDAGFVRIELTLDKELVTGPNYFVGKHVTYTLTPHNSGTTDALAGWSVTEVLPSQLTLVSMSGGATYNCVELTLTCTSTVPLAAGADGDVITVEAVIDAEVVGVVHNVAYVAPVAGDDTEDNPLGTPPTTDTDTSVSPTNNDDEAIFTVEVYSIGNQVWFDTNNNGAIDAGEVAVEGVEVWLFADADANGTPDSSTPIAVDTTDPAGLYLFDRSTDLNGSPTSGTPNLVPGSYVVGIGPGNFESGGALFGYWSSGTTLSSPELDHGADDGTDNDDNGMLAAVGAFAGWVLSDSVGLLPAAEVVEEDPYNNDDGIVPDANSDLTVDFGFYTIAIGDLVWLDNGVGNGILDDGVRQSDERPLQGIPVNLLDADLNPVLDSDGNPITDTTDLNGNYLFTGLPAGVYVVEIEIGAGYSSSSDPVTANDPSNSTDDDDNGIGAADGPTTIITNLLTMIAGDNSNGDIVDDTNGSTTNPRVDFGVYAPPVSIGNQVWYDQDNDGLIDSGEEPIAGVRVELFFDADDSGTLTGGELLPVAVDYTDSDGLYLFDRLTDGTGAVGGIPTLLTPGSYVVGIAAVNFNAAAPLEGLFSSLTTRATNGALVEANTYSADDQSDNDDNGTLASAGSLAGYVLSDYIDLQEGQEPLAESAAIGAVAYNNDNDTVPDANSDLTIDFGFYAVAIGDYVWVDLDRDGQQDLAEAALPGVTVNLYSGDGVTLIDSTTTDGNGWYAFDLQPAGEYQIDVVAPYGYVFTTQDEGDNTSDSDVDGGGSTGPITIVPTAPVMEDTSVYALGSVTAVLIDPTWDAGVVPVVAVGDYTWYDVDHNGVQDIGEDPLDGVVVTLFNQDGSPATDANGDPVAPTTTGTLAPGYYVFDNLLPGTYYVVFTLPADAAFTLQEVGSDREIDSNPDESNGRTPDFTLNPSTNTLMQLVDENDQPTGITYALYIDPSVDAGIWQPLALGDYTWVDWNQNGVQDSGEPALDGVTVELLNPDLSPASDADGNPVASVVTGAGDWPAGYYVFDNLLEGNYVVRFTLPSGYLFTQTGAGTEATDSNPAPATGVTGTISLTPSSTNVRPVNGNDEVSIATLIDPTIDAGVIPVVAIGDYTWIDLDQDGVQDSGEPDLADVDVTLFQADGVTSVLDADGNAVLPTTTDADGWYQFDNLLPGDYVIVFDLPGGYVFTQTGAGTSATDSDPTAGVFPTSGATPVFTVAPSATGDTVVDVDPTTEAVFVNPTIDAGVVPTVAVGDYTWIDENQNGIQDDGEPALDGVEVTLLDGDGNPATDAQGNPVPSVFTDTNGFYLFDNLLPGDYQIQFDLPAGWAFTTQSAPGSTSEDDSNPSIATGLTPVFSIAPEASGDTVFNDLYDSSALFVNPTIDAGVVAIVAVGDYTWIDNDHDGVQEEGEADLPGVTVTLLNPDRTPALDVEGNVVPAVLTDADGFYLFDNLAPGDYVIQFSAPLGYSPTVTGNGTPATDSNPDNTGFTPVFTIEWGVAGDTVADEDDGTRAVFVNPTIDAGFFQEASIGDRVWYDTDRDGVQDPGELGVPGVPVNLYDGIGNSVGATVTDANGNYSFTGLVPGDYFVEFPSIPSGYVITGQDLGGNDTTDSDVNVTTRRTIVTTLDPGENDPTWDLGIHTPRTSPPIPGTGADSLPLVQMALWLLGGGAVILLLARRRRRVHA